MSGFNIQMLVGVTIEKVEFIEDEVAWLYLSDGRVFRHWAAYEGFDFGIVAEDDSEKYLKSHPFFRQKLQSVSK